MTAAARPSQATSEEPATPAAGRPRDREIGDRILASARELLAEGGYEAMTFEAIVGRTGIGRPTIYRRYPTKAHLAAAVAYGERGKLPETGETLRDQLSALVSQIVEIYARPEMGAATAGLITAYQSDPGLRDELHTPAEADARRQLREIVDRAKRKGYICAGSDADMLFDMVVGTLVFRMIHSSVPRPSGFADQFIDTLCRAFSPPQ